MKTIILAGGLGTRLKEITENKPKVMVIIDNRPFLEYLILWLKRYQLTDVILCVGYLSEQIENYFENGNQWGVTISYSQEKNPLGTAGAIKLAEDFIKDDSFLVMNGDSFLDINLIELIKFHHQKKAISTIALTEVKNSRQYGRVEIDENSVITGFVEKGEDTKSYIVNGGIYVFNKKIFDYIAKGKKVSLEKEIFPKLTGTSKGGYGCRR